MPVKPTFVLVAVWLAAAAAAVGVGFLAVSLVDASAAPPAQTALAARPTEAETSSPATAPSGEQPTPGGTVYASCVGGAARLAGAPASGWTAEQSADHVEFRDGTSKIEVRADCSTGSPQFAVEDPPADGSGGKDDGPTATTAATPAMATTSSTADSSGHEADDPAGDDHGGGRGGGHGADE